MRSFRRVLTANRAHGGIGYYGFRTLEIGRRASITWRGPPSGASGTPLRTVNRISGEDT